MTDAFENFVFFESHRKMCGHTILIVVSVVFMLYLGIFTVRRMLNWLLSQVNQFLFLKRTVIVRFFE